jgi:Kef-type K+ transport system membrane component KefB
MSTSEIFLIAMTIIFTVPYLVWRLFRTEYYAPLVVVQIIGGILLGPGVLGAVFPDYYRFVFNPQVIGLLNGIAQWAVMIFVWVAGIESTSKRLGGVGARPVSPPGWRWACRFSLAPERRRRCCF